MRISLGISFTAHAMFLLFTIMGFSWHDPEPLPQPQGIAVDFIEELPEKEAAQPDTDERPLPPKAEPEQASAEPMLTPAPVAEEMPDPSAVPPLEQSENEKKPEAKKDEEKLQAVANLRPPERPANIKKSLFTSVLKTVGEFRTTPKQKNEAEQKDEQASVNTPIGNAGLSDSITNSVRQQIQPCWLFNPGARGAANFDIYIRATLNSDGTVAYAELEPDGRYQTDSFYRAAADSAFRAINNPHCQPFKLPAQQYATWKSIRFRFNPKEMLGQ